jgi:hypothetical protein
LILADGHRRKTLQATPAMEAGISDPLWTLVEIAGFI